MISWKRLALTTALLIGALLLQQTLLRWIAVGSIRPDLLLIVITVIALRHGSIAGLYAGMAAGLVQDVYAVEALGANSLAKCLVGYGLGIFEEKVVKIMPASRVLLLAGAFLFHDAVFLLAAGTRGKDFWNTYFYQSMPSAIYTLVLGAVIFFCSAALRPREQ